MSQKIEVSQTNLSLKSFDWEKVVDFTKRVHIDYFAQKAPIEDYYPLDSQKNIDISHFFK